VPKRRQLCRFAVGADIQHEALGCDFNIAKRCCTGPRERVFQSRWPAALRALITGHQPIEAYRELLVEPAQGIVLALA